MPFVSGGYRESPYVSSGGFEVVDSGGSAFDRTIFLAASMTLSGGSDDIMLVLGQPVRSREALPTVRGRSRALAALGRQGESCNA